MRFSHPVTASGRVDTVLVKTASRCNFDCSYCYIYQGPDTGWRSQPKRMRRDTLLAVRERLTAHAAHQRAGFAIVLHGGEPLLLGFEDLAILLRGLRASMNPNRYPISIQTNGALLSEESLDLFAETRTSVSVSIDGPRAANDIARLDHRGRSTFSSVLRGIRLLAAHPEHDFLFAGTLSVIQPSISPDSVYAFLKELDTPSMDFLLQDGNHDRLPPGKSHFTTTEYGDWLVRLFDLYLSDKSSVPIRIFDDLIKLYLGGSNQKEGVGKDQHGILIIETNGEIRKNDTLRASYEGADRFDHCWHIEHCTLDDVLSSHEYLSYATMQIPTCIVCQVCPFLPLCGGGMPLYRWSEEHGYNSPSVYCKDHARLISHAVGRLEKFDFGQVQFQPPR